MDRDISSLMMGTFRGTGRDDFGRERDKRRPLLLDRVMGDQPRVSRCRLLQLPAELLGDIVDLLADNKPALASLALVNSDCRQWARSCQFAEVRFDYGPQTREIILQLARETISRNTAAKKPTIGVCIRKFTMASDSGWVATYNQDLWDSIWGETHESYSQETRDQLREEGNKQYTSWVSLVLGAISMGMPNLETIIWQDRFTVDNTFFTALSQSPAQNIKLCGTPIDKPYLIEPPLTPPSWPLRSLTMARFFETLLRRCAPTLEFLTWDYMDYEAPGDAMSLGEEPLSFPRLRSLKFCVNYLTQSGFSSFLAAPLRHLALPSACDWDALATSLATSEPLLDLETLVIPNLNMSQENISQVVRFMKRHSHIQKLYTSEYDEACGEEARLDQYIIPALSDGFSNLRSLSLAWGGGSVQEETKPHIATIPDVSLQVIGTIRSLEQLSLSAGIRVGWRAQWLVDHDNIRTHLRGLGKLKLLALNRDTYPIPLAIPDIERYYTLNLVTESEHADAWARPELDDLAEDLGQLGIDGGIDADDDGVDEDVIWERAHRNRMLDQAEKYAAVLPALEWVYCGQRPMAIQMDLSKPALKKAVPLTKERDESYTFLKRTFAMGTDED
ncbi:uncharacterized protein BCR38DRAFT_402313 [Pseudomassariella vexata]|uniref:F-box domain-containing protein n=1 Tax=Pseudomassariella vexata TaxID=1141098 RepID=A0A1Y2DBM0_9PEZI|nr:uncharacterized protein BCR38DRAFT_402313 [Pseudomassariella vexata]ORY56661.1 hypothetical protein BCR38DRAFT_402313 [Pseudomassariella vexata]